MALACFFFVGNFLCFALFLGGKYMDRRKIENFLLASRFVQACTKNLADYSESKYSVQSVSGKYLKNGWSNQHGDFSVEFVIEKLTTLFFCT